MRGAQTIQCGGLPVIPDDSIATRDPRGAREAAGKPGCASRALAGLFRGPEGALPWGLFGFFHGPGPRKPLALRPGSPWQGAREAPGLGLAGNGGGAGASRCRVPAFPGRGRGQGWARPGLEGGEKSANILGKESRGRVPGLRAPGLPCPWEGLGAPLWAAACRGLAPGRGAFAPWGFLAFVLLLAGRPPGRRRPCRPMPWEAPPGLAPR
jgi:hypothetical protein